MNHRVKYAAQLKVSVESVKVKHTHDSGHLDWLNFAWKKILYCLEDTKDFCSSFEIHLYCHPIRKTEMLS